MNKQTFLKKFEEVKSTHKDAVSFRIEAFSETDEEYARLKSIDPKYPWIHHATTIIVNECYHITLASHRSKGPQAIVVANTTRWLEELLAK